MGVIEKGGPTGLDHTPGRKDMKKKGLELGVVPERLGDL